MPSWKPRVELDTARQQRQLDQLGVARPGPTSYGPLDGHIRLHDGTNDTGYLNFDGIQVRFRGALSGLTGLTESFASSLDDHNDQLSDHEGRLDGHDSTLSSHDTRITDEVADRKSADTTLHGRVSTEATQRKDADSALSGRVSTAQSRADSAWARAGNAQSAANSAASAASTATARATKIINCINAVQPEGTGTLATASYSTMSTASVWQQLKNCINS